MMFEYKKLAAFRKVEEHAKEGWRLVCVIPRLDSNLAEYVMERPVGPVRTVAAGTTVDEAIQILLETRNQERIRHY